ncbi:hypothetical protein [Eubacterium aggregans]|uniref:hypothetical protein n=1 Tax=Eubacterium aggregans TaxID=81409 RepID=UPI003F349533
MHGHEPIAFEMLMLDNSEASHGIRKWDRIQCASFDLEQLTNGSFVIFIRDGSEYSELGTITFAEGAYAVTDMRYQLVDMAHSSILGIAVSILRDIDSRE